MSLFASAVSVANRTVLDVHGEPVTYAPTGKAVETITAVVVDPETVGEVSPGVVAVIESSSNEFTTRPAKGDAVTLGEQEYKIFDVKEPRPGWLRIALKK